LNATYTWKINHDVTTAQTEPTAVQKTLDPSKSANQLRGAHNSLADLIVPPLFDVLKKLALS